MKTPADKLRDALIRLRNEYEGKAAEADKVGRQPGNAGLISRGKAACYRAVAIDLNDLIQGREHPSARRG